MSLTNPFEDVELSEPQAMRALAHPVRLAILGQLQRSGPSTATRLAPHVGATPSVVSWHLRHLASFGLVRDAAGEGDGRERWWEAVGRGFRFLPPDDPADVERETAYRALTDQMFARSAAQARRWLDADEPRLPRRWRRLGGHANTRITVSAAELEGLEQAIEALLAPYVLRDPEDAPRGARTVRLLRFVMPEAAERDRGSAREEAP
jgi:DNA-binding transcriptional ArsR family regulator